MELNQCLESMQILQDNSRLKLEAVILFVLFMAVALFFTWISKQGDWDIPTLIIAGIFGAISILIAVKMVMYPIQLKFYVMSDEETLVHTMQYFTLESAISQVDDMYICQISPKDEIYKDVLKFERTLNTHLTDLIRFSSGDM